MKKFINEFKAFISKGDVMSMAVGIIIGGAFTAIVNSLVTDIITPLLGLILGGLNFSELSVGIGDAQVMYGNFIQAIITFLLTALVIFWIMKGFNKMASLSKKPVEEDETSEDEPEPTKEELLLQEIRDILKEK